MSNNSDSPVNQVFFIGSDEKWIRSGHFLHEKGSLNTMYCFGHLTSKRFVVCKISSFLQTILTLFGVLGIVIMSKLQPNRIHLEIPASDISSIEEIPSTGMLKRHKVSLKTRKGEEVRLVFISHEERAQWMSDITRVSQNIKNLGTAVEIPTEKVIGPHIISGEKADTWRCSECRGFVRKESKLCKHCKVQFQ